MGHLIRRIKANSLALGLHVFIVLFSFLGIDVLEVAAAEDLDVAVQCSFSIPPQFVPGKESGLFVNTNSPMESSTIKYYVYDNGMDKALTNRERKELQESGAARVVDESLSLTKEIYETQIAKAYEQEYGENVGFKVESFTKIKVDGYPGFKIESSYQKQDEETIHQTVYLVLSRFRVFTITYQRAEDDDCEELFDASAATIHVR